MEDHDKVQMQEIIKVMLDAQTKTLVERMDRTDATLAPIAAIYSSTQGFSSTMRFLFKSFIVPLSILVGIVLTLKQLLYGHIILK